MATRRERDADRQYERVNDPQISDEMQDSTYVRSQQKTVPVQRDTEEVEDPIKPGGRMNADEVAARDEDEVINQSNIMSGDRTRHAKPQSETRYSEGPDEEDMET